MIPFGYTQMLLFEKAEYKEDFDGGNRPHLCAIGVMVTFLISNQTLAVRVRYGASLDSAPIQS